MRGRVLLLPRCRGTVFCMQMLNRPHRYLSALECRDPVRRRSRCDNVVIVCT